MRMIICRDKNEKYRKKWCCVWYRPCGPCIYRSKDETSFDKLDQYFQAFSRLFYHCLSVTLFRNLYITENNLRIFSSFKLTGSTSSVSNNNWNLIVEFEKHECSPSDCWAVPLSPLVTYKRSGFRKHRGFCNHSLTANDHHASAT